MEGDGLSDCCLLYIYWLQVELETWNDNLSSDYRGDFFWRKHLLWVVDCVALCLVFPRHHPKFPNLELATRHVQKKQKRVLFSPQPSTFTQSTQCMN